MPVPTPNNGEDQATFVGRCIKFLMDENPSRDSKQAQAICYTQFRQKESMHPDFQRIYNTFIHQFGDVEGILKFESFVEKNKLDVLKQYHPAVQYKESFEWVQPLIQMYKQDKDAKYYLIRALTANVSMKNTDWSDYEKMKKAAETLSWRPVNFNHDHSTWLPFPRTRVDFTKADDFSVEATLRVDNQDRKLQEMLDSGKIMHPSIEARPNVDGGYQFTAMAMVVAGEDLPGDPCTEIKPLMFNESIGKEMCKLIDGKLICSCMETQKLEVKETMNENEPNIKEYAKQTIEKAKIFIESLKEEDLITKIKDIKTQLATIDNKLYPPSTLTETEKKALFQQKDLLYVELDAYKTALNSLIQMPSITKIQESIAVKEREKTELLKQTTDLTSEVVNLKKESIKTSSTLADLSEKNAVLMRENTKIEIANNQVRALTESLATTTSELNEAKGKVEAKSEEIVKLEKEVNKQQSTIKHLEESLGRLEAESEKTRHELNTESISHANDKQELLNQTKETNRLKLENAELLEAQAGYIKKESLFSDQLSVNAKRDIQTINENKELKAKVFKLEETVAANETAFKRVELLNKKAHRILEQHGIVEVDPQTGELRNPV